MAVQNSVDNTNVPLILSGDSLIRYENIEQLIGRTTPILYGTVMAKKAAGNWTPFNNVAGVDGSAIPRGIYLGNDITAAAIAADNKDGCAILVGGCCTVNESLVVFDDGTLNADSIIGVGTIHAATARDVIAEVSGIFFEGTVNISEHEN
ncbi:MAG: hypothetical protein ABFC57_10835 [Veillonellales bacterium]